MSEHYYNPTPSSVHDERVIEAKFFNKTFQFKTDAGVFSKSRVDYGTTVLLENISFPKEAKVLDLGCGYGPVGIVTGSILLQGSVQMVDINERAVELAKSNVIKNRRIVNENIKIEVFQSDGFQGVKDKDFDLIILNPPIRAGKELVHQLLEESFQHLKVGGELWIVIQKKQGASSAMKKLASIFPSVRWPITRSWIKPDEPRKYESFSISGDHKFSKTGSNIYPIRPSPIKRISLKAKKSTIAAIGIAVRGLTDASESLSNKV